MAPNHLVLLHAKKETQASHFVAASLNLARDPEPAGPTLEEPLSGLGFLRSHSQGPRFLGVAWVELSIPTRVSHFTACSERKPSTWTSRRSAGLFLNKRDPGNWETYAQSELLLLGRLEGASWSDVDDTPHWALSAHSPGRGSPCSTVAPPLGLSQVTPWDERVPAVLLDDTGVDDKSSSDF